MRKVLLGTSLGDSYIVLEGLEAGEEVVTSGAFSIDAAAQLAGKPSMMDPDGGAVMRGHDHGGSATPAKVEATKVESAEISAAAKAQLKPMMVSYLSMKDALVLDDFGTAKEHGEQLKAALEKVDMKLFKGDAHMKWMEVSGVLSASMEHMAHFSDIIQLREALKPISAQMVILAMTFDPMDETIYLEFCPMADDNKGGNWLSLEKEIKNPYFGASMLKCGKVTEEIK
jgi:Cu(I)/Ag(I) efflux system membrane fusion protein